MHSLSPKYHDQPSLKCCLNLTRSVNSGKLHLLHIRLHPVTGWWFDSCQPSVSRPLTRIGANLVIWPQKSGSYQTCLGLYSWQSAQPRYETNNGSNVLSLLWMQVKTFPCDTEQQPEFWDDWQSTHWCTLNFYYTTQHFNLQQLFFNVLFRGEM